MQYGTVRPMSPAASLATETPSSKVAFASEHGQDLRLIRDAIANYSSTIFSACVGIVMVPIMLDGLGAQAYGLLITSLMVGSILPIDMGIGWSLTHEIAMRSSDETPS